MMEVFNSVFEAGAFGIMMFVLAVVKEMLEHLVPAKAEKKEEQL